MGEGGDMNIGIMVTAIVCGALWSWTDWRLGIAAGAALYIILCLLKEV